MLPETELQPMHADTPRERSRIEAEKERIIVVGGGAGGLELAVKLARKLKRADSVEVVLIDKNPTHIWKPLFHEVATGSMNSYHDEASYRMLARKHSFRFLLGRVSDIDTDERLVVVDRVLNDEGEEIMPEREVCYDRLVVSVGSHSNDFGIDGVREHARQLDSREEAELFNRHFASMLHRINSRGEPEAQLNIAIVGGGATGVELAADMHNVAGRLKEYGFEHFSRERLRVSILEAAPALLPRLPGRVGISVKRELERIGVKVYVGTMVSKVNRDSVVTNEGESIPADISVWAAGVRAPEWLADCGFAADKLGRVVVEPDLRIKGHDNIYALGDCCSFYREDGTEVPPRAQAAHQMASVVVKNICRQRKARSTKPFVYKDFGSLVNLSKYSTVGNLMGNLMRGTVFIEGWLARVAYLSLYRMHQAAIHGVFSMLLIMLGDRIYRATRAEVKLH